MLHNKSLRLSISVPYRYNSNVSRKTPVELADFAYLGFLGEMGLNCEIVIDGTNNFYTVCCLILLNPSRK